MAYSLRHMVDAIRAREVDVVRKAIASGTQLNRTDSMWTSALHVALETDSPDRAILRVLCEAGCSIVSSNRDGENVLDVAKRRGHDAELQFLLNPQNHGGPSWHRDAVRLGCPVLVLRVSRGWGFGWNPNDLEKPFLSEGTYMGFGQPIDAGEGAEMFDNLLESSAPELAWFAPYMEGIVTGRDFDLEQLISEHGDDCQKVDYWIEEEFRG